MKRIFITVLSIIGLSVSAQVSYLSQDNVAIFYPHGFKPAQTMPSSVLLEEPRPYKALPANWQIVPRYAKPSANKAIITIDIPQGTDLYGTGEVLGNLRRNDTEIELWNTDNYAYGTADGKRLYQSHPWVLGVREDGTAFGVIIDCTWRMDIKLSDKQIKVTTDGVEPRVIVIESGTPKEVIAKLGQLSGNMELPPLWALGYQQCRFSYYPDTQVKELADTFRDKKLPCDVIWMDIDYMDGYRVFTFDEKGFPNPKELNDYLHSKNFKSVYMIDPGIKKDSNYFVWQQGEAIDAWVKDKDGKTYDGAVWPGICNFPDFTRRDVREWWSGLYKEFMATGIDGIWNDMNEPAVFGTDSKTMPIDNVLQGDGNLPKGSHLRYHNIYGMLMVEASRDGMLAANPDKRPFVLSRANFLGGQRYAYTWTGDNASTWDYLRTSIPMTLNMALSASSFNGPDIGGFVGDANPELLEHWMALGVYFPFFRNHSGKGSVEQEPWVFGKRTEDITRTSLNRRYRLLPYLYTLTYESSVNSAPIMQPAFFADLTNKKLREEQELFLMGDNLLIIPRWASDFELPKGNWSIVEFEKKDDGVQPYVAIKEGAIVPLANEGMQSTMEYNADSITLIVNPNKNGVARGEMYSDSGDGFGYKNGEYSITEFTSHKEGDRLVVKATHKEGNLTPQRTYRVGLSVDGKMYYSAWTNDNEITIKNVESKGTGIDKKRLKMHSRNFADNKSLHDILHRNKIEGEEHDGVEIDI